MGERIVIPVDLTEIQFLAGTMNNTNSRAEEHDERRHGGRGMTGGDGLRDEEDHEDNSSLTSHKNDPVLLPRKRSEATKSPAEEVVAFGMAEAVASTASFKTIANDSNNYAGVGDEALPPSMWPELEGVSGSRRNATPMRAAGGGDYYSFSNIDEVDGDDGALSLHASFDAVAGDGGISGGMSTGYGDDNDKPKKKEYASPKRRKKQDINVKPQLPQHYQQSDSVASLKSSYSSTSSASSTLLTPNRPQTRMMTAAQQQQQLQQQQQRHRRRNVDGNDGSILFSPRPIATMMYTNSILPPRPFPLGRTRGNASLSSSAAANAATAMATPSSPLTPSPKSAIKTEKGKEGRKNSSSSMSSPSSSSALTLCKSQSFSPTNNATTMTTNMTPFRFHSFPASLPRVNVRGDDNVGDVTMTTLRPKHQHQLQRKQPHPPLPPSRLPPSPATRRLFIQSNDADNKLINYNTVPTPLMAVSKSSTNVSGYWSEDASVGSDTNERIRMSKPEIPTRHRHHNSILTTTIAPIQSDLEVEVGCGDDGDSSNGDDAESDTVVMQEDDDEKEERVDELNANENRANAKMLGTSSSLGDDDDIVVDDDYYYKHELLPPPPTTSSCSSGLLSGTKLNFSSPLPPGGEGSDVDDDGLRRGAQSDDEFEDREGGRNKPSVTFTTSRKKKTTNDLLLAPSHVPLETTLHPHTPRGILFTAASASEEEYHMMVNLEVSPIIRSLEDYEEHEMMVDNAEDDDSKEKKGPATISRGLASSGNSIQPLFHHSASPIFPNIEDNFSSLHHHHPSNKVEDTVAETGSLDTSTNSSSVMMPFHTTARARNRNTFPSATQEPSLKTTNTSTATIPTVNRNTTISSPNNYHSTPGKLTPSTTAHRPTAQRKLHRPMPDTSAFDVSGVGSGGGGRSINTPSQQSLGSKDSGFHSLKTGGGGVKGGGSITSGGSGDNGGRLLLCPPTPMRTPAWAHHAIVDSAVRGHDQPLIKRANSLITTKVLAMTACPPGVLENLSSLEDSMLENDITGNTIDTSTAEGGGVGGQEVSISHYNPNHNALLTLEEKDEYDDCIFRSLEDGCAEEDTSPTLPLGNSRDEITSVMPVMSNVPFSNTDNIDNDKGAPSMSNKTFPSSETEEINFSDFDNLGILGSGAFADVYKVRSRKGDRRLYAIKRTRRQFRGVKDRERSMAEVHTMKRLQSALLSEATAVAAASSSSSITTASSSRQKGSGSSGNVSTMGQHHSKSNYGLYLLFFIRAWQQDGFFYCQTELCSRANCRHLRLSLSNEWGRDIARYPSLQMCLLERDADNVIVSSLSAEQDEGLSRRDDRLIPERAIWQICHDISRGLLHIHSYGMVHFDIKPSNIFFVYNSKWGTICKIGDFGLAGDIGTKDDGQEGDTAYMPNELLQSYCEKHPSADIFSLGIALYELAASPLWLLPREGDRWHEIRSEAHSPDLPLSRSENLVKLIRAMTLPNLMERPSAEDILDIVEVKRANALSDSFLSRYVNDVERYDSRREREMESAEEDARRRSSTPIASSSNNSALGSDPVRRVRNMRSPTNDWDKSTFF